MRNFFKRKKVEEKQFPPVPEWQPSIRQPLERLVDRVRYYTDDKRDFAMFQNGTCVILSNGLDDAAAEREAITVLAKVFNAHPDMNPLSMDDGNILVSYNEPAANVVLSDVAEEHWEEIDRNHRRALASDEVLMTPLGPNMFDEVGKKALFGRCFMFMDAQHPVVVQVVRKVVE